VLGLCRGKGALSAAGRIKRHSGSLLEECRRGGQAAPRLRPVGRALELGGHVLIRCHGRLRAVPRSAVGIELRIRDLRQGAVNVLPLLTGCRPVGR